MSSGSRVWDEDVCELATSSGQRREANVLGGSDSTVLLLYLIDGTREEGDRMTEVKTEKKRLTVVVDGVLCIHNV